MFTVIWREYRAVSVSGRQFFSKPLYPGESGALLLEQLTRMPRAGKTPISYDAANALVGTEICKCVDSGEHQKLWHLTDHWVQWLTENGFYVEFGETDYQVIGAVRA